jgi:hypothetical protein
MRRAVTPVIPPSMYRHFAIITVVLTAGLAMFADGENREAQAAPAAPAARPAAPVTMATAAPTAASRRSPGWWDGESEFDSGFGQPAEPLSDSGSSSEVANATATPSPRRSPAGPAALTEEERELLLAGLQNGATPAP